MKQNWSELMPREPWRDWYNIKDPSLTGKEEHLHKECLNPYKHDLTFWETKALSSVDSKVKLLRATEKAEIHEHASLLCLWTKQHCF